MFWAVSWHEGGMNRRTGASLGFACRTSVKQMGILRPGHTPEHRALHWGLQALHQVGSHGFAVALGGVLRRWASGSRRASTWTQSAMLLFRPWPSSPTWRRSRRESRDTRTPRVRLQLARSCLQEMKQKNIECIKARLSLLKEGIGCSHSSRLCFPLDSPRETTWDPPGCMHES